MDDAQRTPAPALAKWAVLAAVLILALTFLRYVEPMLRKARLEQRMAEMQAAWDRRPDIDRELLFLQHLQTNQPPFLEVLSVMAGAAGPGTKLDSLSLNRRGEMSLKGVIPDSKQAGDFRSKLIDSGWFAAVVLEEQTPVENQKKVNVRLNGHWKPAGPVKPAPESDDGIAGQKIPAALQESSPPSP